MGRLHPIDAEDGRRIAAFLEMMAAEAGAARNTLLAYERDLRGASVLLGGRLAGADAEALRPLAEAWMSLKRATVARKAAALRRFFGFLQDEGMRADEIQARHPRAWEDWLQFREDHAMPEGESPRQFHARIIEALGRIATENAGQRLLVVTHGGVLDMVWRTARGLGLNGPRQSDIPNAGFNRIRIADAAQPDQIEIVDWADTRHLSDLPEQPTYDQRRHL